MLLNNYSVLNSNPGREIGGGGVFNLFTYYKAGTWNNFYTGESSVIGETDKSSFYNSYRPPYSLLLAPKAGGIGSVNNLESSFSYGNANLAGGLNATADLSAVFSIPNANLGLIVSATADILATFDVDATIVGQLNMSADLAFSGSIVASLTALGNAVAALNSTFTFTASQYAIGNMSADISTETTLSPQSLAAAVWNAIAADFNTAGTMGNKLNSAASAGDPWGTALPGSYLSTEAGGILSQIQTLVDELHKIQGLDASNPMTVTPTSRVSGSIDLDITGDGETTTTVTRQ